MRDFFSKVTRNDKQFILSVIIGMGFVILYSRIGPGEEFFGAYTRMVLEQDNISEMVGLFSPVWLAPIMSPFVTMPGRAGYILFLGVLISLTIVSTRILKGNLILPLLSAQMFWVLWWGQIEPLVIFGLALGWIAVKEKNWQLLTVSLLLMSLKPQMTLFPAITLWWWIGKDRWYALLSFLVS